MGNRNAASPITHSNQISIGIHCFIMRRNCDPHKACLYDVGSSNISDPEDHAGCSEGDEDELFLVETLLPSRFHRLETIVEDEDNDVLKTSALQFLLTYCLLLSIVLVLLSIVLMRSAPNRTIFLLHKSKYH